MRFIDIGANLLDEMYKGRYNDKEYHAPDLPAVLQRAWDAGMERMIITAGNLEEAKAALELARTDERLFCTVGVHPTRCSELAAAEGGEAAYLDQLRQVIAEGKAEGKVVALGECGLDYDRLHFCDMDTQRRGFRAQLALAAEAELPMFLHLRAAADDFVSICNEHAEVIAQVGGVVHSFDGTLDELRAVLTFERLCIGINGCSLKTADNLDVMAAVPTGRLMIETDCPWCDIRPSHAGKQYVQTSLEAKDKKKHSPELLVKGRNEPCNIRQVLEVVAGHRGEDDLERLAEEVYATTARMFFPGARDDGPPA